MKKNKKLLLFISMFFLIFNNKLFSMQNVFSGASSQMQMGLDLSGLLSMKGFILNNKYNETKFELEDILSIRSCIDDAPKELFNLVCNDVRLDYISFCQNPACKLGSFDGLKKRINFVEFIRDEFKNRPDRFIGIDLINKKISIVYTTVVFELLFTDFHLLNMIIMETLKLYVDYTINLRIIFIVSVIDIEKLFGNSIIGKPFKHYGFYHSALLIHPLSCFSQFIRWFESLKNVEVQAYVYSNHLKYITDCAVNPSLKSNIFVSIDYPFRYFDALSALKDFTLKRDVSFTFYREQTF